MVGILGGGAGTAMDAFQFLSDVRKYGARVVLFGRKINLSEHPLAFIKFLRAIADGAIAPEEAVKAYHGELHAAKIAPLRPLKEDLQLTQNLQKYG